MTHIAANGPKNTVYPLINDKNFGAEAKISQGHNAQPPIIAQMIWPLLMFRYCGSRTVMSFPALTLFPETFVPSVASINEKEAKKAAARLSHLSTRLSGSQRTSPYIFSPAEVTAIPARRRELSAHSYLNFRLTDE